MKFGRKGAGRGGYRASPFVPRGCGQAGTDAVPRVYLRKQLETWERHGTDAYVSDIHKRVYQLLAGNVASVDGETESWETGLGLVLWYSVEPSATVTDIVGAYEQGASDGCVCA